MNKKPNKGGRPPFEPTPEQRKTVEAMVGYGIPQDDICKVILKPDGAAITKPTLEKHFRLEIDQGAVKANAKIAESLFKQAVGEAAVVEVQADGSRRAVKQGTAPNVSAGIWWTKARMGWRETVDVGVEVSHVGRNERIARISELLDRSGARGTAAASGAGTRGNGAGKPH